MVLTSNASGEHSDVDDRDRSQEVARHRGDLNSGDHRVSERRRERDRVLSMCQYVRSGGHMGPSMRDLRTQRGGDVRRGGKVSDPERWRKRCDPPLASQDGKQVFSHRGSFGGDFPEFMTTGAAV